MLSGGAGFCLALRKQNVLGCFCLVFSAVLNVVARQHLAPYWILSGVTEWFLMLVLDIYGALALSGGAGCFQVVLNVYFGWCFWVCSGYVYDSGVVSVGYLLIFGGVVSLCWMLSRGTECFQFLLKVNHHQARIKHPTPLGYRCFIHAWCQSGDTKMSLCRALVRFGVVLLSGVDESLMNVVG